MKPDTLKVYRCPKCLSSLSSSDDPSGDELLSGTLTCEEGHTFDIKDGIPDLTWPKELGENDKEFRETYDKLAEEYEKFADFPFRTFECSEHDLRVKMTDQLNLKEGDTVLEIGCGDGRGSQYIAERIGASGTLYMQELSRAFLMKAIDRVQDTLPMKEYAVANASYLSFADNTFDAAHHFGGINTFDEVERCLQELVRVVKPGGKILVGDEGMGPWLKEMEFGKIMMNSNPLLRYEIPFDKIPVDARDVKVEWVVKGAFFILEFTVGEGTPEANYHIPIPSDRGGTHWTRYYGHLEGISDEAKEMAYKAQKKSGLSMAAWLEKVVIEASNKQ